ncbi:MAG: alpha/beta hydrolase [Desulfobacterales bacterium]|nr:alpha/beta hydrolase [Desulfobacterales bacterium]
MDSFTQRPFRVDFGDRALVGDVLTGDASARVLILHGAGNSERKRFEPLRRHLAARGISSCAFDFIGHGDTGGQLIGSSLEERTGQACRVIDAQAVRRPLALVAASMGAYTAVKLLEHYPVEVLVLLVPAMYAAEAYRVPFGPGFSETIRRPESWQSSDAWALLAAYAGRLLIVAAENDTVIPPGVIRRLHDSAVRARDRRLCIVPGVSHFVFTELRARDPEGLARVQALIVGVLREGAADDTDAA